MRPLTTLDLNTILGANKVTKNRFIGTYPSCITPNTSKRTYAFITNVDQHDLPGQHWNAWFIDGSKISFFDSFGRNHEDETLPKHYTDIVKSFEQIAYSTTRIQGWDSVACGLFCIHFIYHKCLGLDYETFLNEYSISDFEKNDLIVQDFIKSIK